MKDKTTAGLLAVLLGGFGVHKFYLGNASGGFLYVLFCWTMIPAIIGLVEGITYLSMSDQAFNAKFNGAAMLGGAQAVQGLLAPPMYAPPMPAQNIVVNVPVSNGPGIDVAAQIKVLFELKQAGALTQEEFDAQKKKLLGAS